MPQQLFKEFAQLDQVEAIVLGGSRTGQHFDKDSDYDVYIYLTDSIAPLTRRDILSKYCSYMEIGNQFWELEDDCVLRVRSKLSSFTVHWTALIKTCRL